MLFALCQAIYLWCPRHIPFDRSVLLHVTCASCPTPYDTAPPAPLRGPRQGAGDRGFMDTHALALLSASALTVGFGLVRLACWARDRKHAAMVAQIEQAALVAIAYREVRRG